MADQAYKRLGTQKCRWRHFNHKQKPIYKLYASLQMLMEHELSRRLTTFTHWGWQKRGPLAKKIVTKTLLQKCAFFCITLSYLVTRMHDNSQQNESEYKLWKCGYFQIFVNDPTPSKSRLWRKCRRNKIQGILAIISFKISLSPRLLS